MIEGVAPGTRSNSGMVPEPGMARPTAPIPCSSLNGSSSCAELMAGETLYTASTESLLKLNVPHKCLIHTRGREAQASHPRFSIQHVQKSLTKYENVKEYV